LERHVEFIARGIEENDVRFGEIKVTVTSQVTVTLDEVFL
jgi:hypothetical protein